MNLFISYSRDDKAWTDEFWHKLRDENHDMWIDQRLVGANTWWATILEHIEACDCFLIIVTPHALDSVFCQAELDYALALNKPVLPLMLKPCDSLAVLGEIPYVDISGDIAMDQALLRVIRALHEINLHLESGKYSARQAERSPIPRPEPGQPEHSLAVFAVAEEAAAEGNLMQAKILYQQIADAHPDGLGVAAQKRLSEIYFQENRAHSHPQAVRQTPKSDAEYQSEALSERLSQTEISAMLPQIQPAPPPNIQRLLDTITNPNVMPAERASIGDELAALGDPRPGVGLRKDGLPDIDWVEIPAGEFIYQDGEPFTVPTFYIARYPVTWLQFQAFIDDPDGYANREWWRALMHREVAPVDARWAIANRPRERVSWYQAIAFSRWLSAKLGYDISLPTEQQWEKAARGTDGCIYPWGYGYVSGYANINETYKDYRVGAAYLGQTTAVGIYPQSMSPYGILDMCGNIWEWCMTEYLSQKNHNLSNTNTRTVRGGSFIDGLHFSRTDVRLPCVPGFLDSSVGFRLVRI